MSYITTFLPDKDDTEKEKKINPDTISEEQYKSMSLAEIVEYFNNYSKIKAFCRSLEKEPSSAKIILITNDDVITEENVDNIKNTLLSFMKLPETTKAKNKEIKAKYAKFRATKYYQIMISFVIIKNKLQTVSNDNQQTT
jgi:hypothetical protein